MQFNAIIIYIKFLLNHLFFFNLCKNTMLNMTNNNIPTILIVDDVSTNVLLLEIFFRSQPYNIIKACNGEEALEIIESKLPDLILLDIMMPGISGIEVALKLNENSDTEKIPVIFLTAYGEEMEMPEELKNEKYDILSKPFIKDKLFEKINHKLNK